MWIGAIWGGVEGKAIQWMHSASHLKQIINLLRSTPHLITKEMADQFAEEFEETFRLVEEPENQQSLIEMLNSLEQGRNEPLADYYTRARGVLQLLGVKGLPQRNPSFSVMRAAIIEMTVSRVVSGLSEDALKVKAIERGVASSSNLEECFRIIREVRNSMTDARKQFLLHRENWKSKYFDRILKAPNQVTEVIQGFAYRYNNLISRKTKEYSIICLILGRFILCGTPGGAFSNSGGEVAVALSSIRIALRTFTISGRT